MNNIKSTNGITLVALVITIIILLILAGITLNMVLGENGLLKRAEEGAEIYKNASKDELGMLNEIDKNLDNALDNPPEGMVEISEITWTENKANVTLTTQTEYEIQYQINDINEENWQIGKEVGNLKLNDIVYARVWNGRKGGNNTSKTIIDEIDPNEANIEIEINNTNEGAKIKAKIEQIDEQSGVNVENCMWTLNEEIEELGIDATKYENRFINNPEEIELSGKMPGIYYLHVLTIDYAGRGKETIKGPIKIDQLVTGITLDKTNAIIDVGNKLKINAVVYPDNADNKTITWTSSNGTIATVDENGEVTGIKGGSVVITAKVNDGSNIEAKCTVTVNERPIIVETAYNTKTTTSISINAKATDVNGGNLTYKLYVSTSNNGGWEEKAVATVAQNTLVTLTAGNLNNYTVYYYYIWVTDGRLSAQTGVLGGIRTFCPGTGLTCYGPFTTQVNCNLCKGTGGGYAGHMWRSGADSGYVTEGAWVCMVCGTETFCNVGIRKVGSGIDKHTCNYCGSLICELSPSNSVPSCSNCGSVAMRTKYKYLKTGLYAVVTGDTCFTTAIKCTNCGGSGKITQNINCVHQRGSQHAYCGHGQLVQHDN